MDGSDALRYEGSSPLARGLLIDIYLVPKPNGIIPARAGFTYWFDDPSQTISDHPRSRGVYRIGLP